MSDDVFREIIKTFNIIPEDRLRITNQSRWRLPEKTTLDSNTQIESAEIMSGNIENRSQDEYYNVTYLQNLFQRMDDILRNGVSEKDMLDGFGYVKPNFSKRNPRIRTKQLYNEKVIDQFVSSLTKFDNELVDSKIAIQFSYILGYVGSGKSTFIKHLELSNREVLSQNNIIVVTLRYREFSEDMYSGVSQEDWNKNIGQRLLGKLIVLAKRIDPHCIQNEVDKSSFQEITGILFNYNILIIIDGFDSLSANKIERKSNVRVLRAIKVFFDEIQKIYNVQSYVDKNCKVIFSLRKCTYEMLNPSTKFGRQDIKDGYFLPAAEFNLVVDELLKYLSGDKCFMKEYKDTIFKIIKEASSRIDEVLKVVRKDVSADLFDNNYRRKLRYISSLVHFFALRVSNEVTGKTHRELHGNFFRRIHTEIKDPKNDHWYVEILIYGLNFGYNNYFSNSSEEDNRGSSCGFVDNIFCYFGNKLDEARDNRINRVLAKLRILQLLYGSYSERKFQYLSVRQIKRKLISIGVVLTKRELCDALDFLEKSLFIRSTYPYETLKLEDSNMDGESGGDKYDAGNIDGDELPDYFKLKTHFKCSNYGSNLLENILFSYPYMTAVSQNSCLPEDYAGFIRYRTKLQHSCGNIFYIDKEWIKEVIPNSLMFFMVMISVEKNNDKDVEYHVFNEVLNSFNETLVKISSGAIESKLTEDELEGVLTRCRNIKKLANI